MVIPRFLGPRYFPEHLRPILSQDRRIYEGSYFVDKIIAFPEKLLGRSVHIKTE